MAKQWISLGLDLLLLVLGGFICVEAGLSQEDMVLPSGDFPVLFIALGTALLITAALRTFVVVGLIRLRKEYERILRHDGRLRGS